MWRSPLERVWLPVLYSDFAARQKGLKRETQRRKDEVEDSIAFRIFLGTLSV
jgi:hypothetical protein